MKLQQPKQFYFLCFALQALLLVITASSFAQQLKGRINGQIINTQNKPAENVTVMLKGTQNGTLTDEAGKYAFRVAAGNYTLIVSHVGAKTQEVSVMVKAGQTVIVPAIKIGLTSSALQEVSVSDDKTNKFVRKQSDYITKIPLKNIENAQVYTTIGKELLEDQMVNSVDAAVKNAPGIQGVWQATGRSGDGGGYYNSRGFILQSQLRNGVAGNVSNSIDAANLESIEVIKGPSATLFGSSLTSYGGLINRVTKKPYDTFGGQVSYMGGSYGYNRVAADVNTPIDSAKKLLFRLNTAFNYQGSFLDHGYARSLAVDPSLLYKVNDRISISFDAEIYNGRNVVQGFFFFPYGVPISALGASNANQLNLDYRKSYNAGDLAQQTQSTNFFGQVNYKISNAWRSQTTFTSTYSYSNGFGPYYYLQPGNNTIDREDQSTKNSSVQTYEAQENIIGDFKIGTLRNRFVGGLDFFRVNSAQTFLGAGLGLAPSNSSTYDYSNFNAAAIANAYKTSSASYPYFYKNNTYSAYVFDVLNITDQLIASAGVRFDHFDNKGSYDPTSGITSGMYTQNAFSPKFGLVYQIVENAISFFGNYQNSFTNLNGTDYERKTFKPQQANQLEGGVKFNVFDGRLTSTLSYYNIDVTNVTRTDPVHPTFQIQDGTQKSKGFEAEVIANPFTGFNIVAGFAYNDSKYTKADEDVNGLRPATASSPYAANLWLSYRLPANWIKGLGVGFGGNYASNNLVFNSKSLGTFTLPEFYVFNTTAFYEISHYRINLGVNNLTDKHYWTGYSTINPQMLRQILAGFAYKF